MNQLVSNCGPMSVTARQKEKQLIAAHFSQAAQSYAQAARVQADVAEVLLAMLQALDGKDQWQWLADLGCGCGLQIDELKQSAPNADILALDLSLEMLRQLQGNTACSDTAAYAVSTDTDQLPLADSALDIAFSSLALQWSRNLSATVEGIARCLKPGGKLLMSTLSHGSLGELETAYQHVDAYRHTNEYPRSHELRSQLENSGMIVERFETQLFQQHYGSLGEMFRCLKASGVNTVTNSARRGLMTPSQYRLLEQAFEQQRTSLGLPLSYHVVFAQLSCPARPTFAQLSLR